MTQPESFNLPNNPTINEIIDNPLIVASEGKLKTRETVTFRPLVREDNSAFGTFLDGLSEETKSRYGPHPITSAEAVRICDNINYSKMLRMVLTNPKKEIIGYMIIAFELRKSQLKRYQDYGIPIVEGRDICIAPVVADEYQGSGAGSIMLERTIEIAKALGVKYIIPWQGTQMSNKRAIRYYKKFGFQKDGEFDRYGTHNIDLSLKLC